MNFNNEIIDGQSTVAENLAKSNRNFMLLKEILGSGASAQDIQDMLNTISQTYVKTADIVNNLTSTATNKPVSALQAKNLKQDIANLTQQLQQLNQNVSNLTQQLNNKVGNNNDNAFLYRGTISNFDEALKTGWYTFVNISNFGYGVLIVQNSTGEPHNNSNNWIWQTTYNTAGVYKRRFKVNADKWTNWIVA